VDLTFGYAKDRQYGFLAYASIIKRDTLSTPGGDANGRDFYETSYSIESQSHFECIDSVGDIVTQRVVEHTSRIHDVLSDSDHPE
jgi:uncharacterized protein (UPF0218 family)